MCFNTDTLKVYVIVTAHYQGSTTSSNLPARFPDYRTVPTTARGSISFTVVRERKKRKRKQTQLQPKVCTFLRNKHENRSKPDFVYSKNHLRMMSRRAINLSAIFIAAHLSSRYPWGRGKGAEGGRAVLRETSVVARARDRLGRRRVRASHNKRSLHERPRVKSWAIITDPSLAPAIDGSRPPVRVIVIRAASLLRSAAPARAAGNGLYSYSAPRFSPSRRPPPPRASRQVPICSSIFLNERSVALEENSSSEDSRVSGRSCLVFEQRDSSGPRFDRCSSSLRFLKINGRCRKIVVSSNCCLRDSNKRNSIVYIYT